MGRAAALGRVAALGSQGPDWPVVQGVGVPARLLPALIAR